MYRVALGVLLGAFCLVPFQVFGLAQTPPPQSAQPTFRSTLDLLTLDTSVRDKRGQPVTDLQVPDFTVTIDGRPRKVVSAVFFKAEATGARLTGGGPPTPQYVANDPAQPGRVVVFAVDSESIRGGQERSLFETASRMLEGLSPADAVGLVEIRGPGIEATRDHSTVVEALERFRGRAPHEVTELGQGSNPVGMPMGANAPIPMLGLKGREHAERVLLDLARLLRGMTVVRAPRTVILISGDLALDRELMAHYKELQRAAAESRTMLYTVLLAEVGYEVSRGETRPEIKRPPALVPIDIDDPWKAEGLATIASMTGGMFFNAAGRPTGIFDRIQSEVSSFYQLAIESSPADADGKEHDVKVRVSRTGVDVRAPAHVAVAKPPSKAAPRDPLLVALQQPTDVPDVPLAISTYSTYGAGGAIQVLMSAEIGAPNAGAPAEWGFAVSQRGKDAIIRRGRIAAGAERPHVVSATMDMPPGDYRLRLAAVDGDDRMGVLDVPFKAGYQKAGATVTSDLVVGVVAAGEFEPRRRLARTGELIATLQVIAGGTVSSGVLQLIPAGSARSVLAIPLSIRPPSSADGPTTLQGRASLASVPAGRYTASAVLEVGGQPATRIDRVIEITGPPPVAPPAGADLERVQTSGQIR